MVDNALIALISLGFQVPRGVALWGSGWGATRPHTDEREAGRARYVVLEKLARLSNDPQATRRRIAAE